MDKYGYPTDEELEELENFKGSPEEMVEKIKLLWHWNDYCKITKRKNGVHVKLITGGWSGNESIVSALEKNMFWFLFWQESHRGGLYKLFIPIESWKKDLCFLHPCYEIKKGKEVSKNE